MNIYLDKLFSDAGKCVELKLDNLKLKAIEGLSVSMGRVMTLFVLVLVLAIVVASFALGCVFLIGDLIGSWAGAAFVVGGVFLLFLIVLYLLRRRLFVNMFVRLFVEVLYDEE